MIAFNSVVKNMFLNLSLSVFMQQVTGCSSNNLKENMSLYMMDLYRIYSCQTENNVKVNKVGKVMKY
jgi:hypothetical protein